jgi:hypothetical protein
VHILLGDDIYNKMKNLIIITSLIACLNNNLFSQVQGPLNPSSFGTDTSIGTFNWTNTGNILASDDSRSSVDLNNSGDISYYLTATNFGFTIPNGSTIDGIVIDIEVSDNSGGGNIKDNSVRIIKGGLITGMDNSNGANWLTGDEYRAHGNSTDLWGTTWTDSDINASNFGVAISARRTGAGGNNTARIDNIQITVYYTEPTSLPVELLYFMGVKKNEYIELHWLTTAEYNNEYFIVYKSRDGISFNKFVRVNGAGNSNHSIHYTIIDIEPYNTTYYKLYQLDYNGNSKSFNTIAIDNIGTSNIKLVKITNILGQEIEDTCDCLKIYYFSDGSISKSYTVR